MDINKVIEHADHVWKVIDRKNKERLFPVSISDISEAVCQIKFLEGIEYVQILSEEVRDSIIKAKVCVYEKALAPYQSPALVASIFFVPQEDERLTHFIAAKELAQILFYGDETGKVDTDDELILLAELLTSDGEALNKLGVSFPYVTERLAEITAAEILLPLDVRVRIIDNLGGQKPDIEKLFSQFMVPPQYLQLLLDPVYHSLMTRLRKGK